MNGALETIIGRILTIKKSKAFPKILGHLTTLIDLHQKRCALSL